jgi:hypothetical protein
MGDEGDYWRDVKEARQRKRAEHGQPCPECVRLLPRANPSILLPGQTCRIHRWRDQRPRVAP